MAELIYTLISIPYLSTGRRLYALKQCLVLAEERGLDALAALILEAIAHDEETVKLERGWARSKNLSTARGNAAVLDGQIDGTLGASHSTLKNHIAALPPENPIVVAAQTILSQVFPEGVKPIITLSFENQLAVNDTIIASFKGDLKEAVAVAGISSYADRLETLNEAFRLELEKFPRKETGYDAIDAADWRGNLFIRRIAAVILGTFHQETAEAAKQRAALLGPILEQGERVRQNRKGRRAPQDVDPETGNEVVEEEISA
jgi:hypothetical protein